MAHNRIKNSPTVPYVFCLPALWCDAHQIRLTLHEPRTREFWHPVRGSVWPGAPVGLFWDSCTVNYRMPRITTKTQSCGHWEGKSRTARTLSFLCVELCLDLDLFQTSTHRIRNAFRRAGTRCFLWRTSRHTSTQEVVVCATNSELVDQRSCKDLDGTWWNMIELGSIETCVELLKNKHCRKSDSSSISDFQVLGFQSVDGMQCAWLLGPNASFWRPMPNCKVVPFISIHRTFGANWTCQGTVSFWKQQGTPRWPMVCGSRLSGSSQARTVGQQLVDLVDFEIVWKVCSKFNPHISVWLQLASKRMFASATATIITIGHQKATAGLAGRHCDTGELWHLVCHNKLWV